MFLNVQPAYPSRDARTRGSLRGLRGDLPEGFFDPNTGETIGPGGTNAPAAGEGPGGYAWEDPTIFEDPFAGFAPELPQPEPPPDMFSDPFSFAPIDVLPIDTEPAPGPLMPMMPPQDIEESAPGFPIDVLPISYPEAPAPAPLETMPLPATTLTPTTIVVSAPYPDEPTAAPPTDSIFSPAPVAIVNLPTNTGSGGGGILEDMAPPGSVAVAQPPIVPLTVASPAPPAVIPPTPGDLVNSLVAPMSLITSGGVVDTASTPAPPSGGGGSGVSAPASTLTVGPGGAIVAVPPGYTVDGNGNLIPIAQASLLNSLDSWFQNSTLAPGYGVSNGAVIGGLAALAAGFILLTGNKKKERRVSQRRRAA